MKEFFRSFFASLLAIIVSGVLLVFFVVVLIIGLAKSITDKDSKQVDGDVLVVDVTKRIHELGEKNPFAAFSETSQYKAGLYDITSAISYAKDDEDIKGIYLKLGPTPNGWATLQELKNALVDFKKSGKFIYSYGESITQGAYYVATASDSIFMNPSGGIELKGFATVLGFFKGALDKLELTPEIFYAGKFKSATEPFRAYEISEPNRLQIQAFQNGMWDQFLTAAASYIKEDKQTIHQWAVDGAIQFPTDALKYGMVAGLRYQDEINELLRTKTGRTEKQGVKAVSMNDYAEGVKGLGGSGEGRIAVLFAEGEIKDGEQMDDNEIASKTLCEEIRKLRKKSKVKAVVLRVNSPGGSALASEVILRELVLLQKEKPLIVSMGDYAASGGYYISSHADSIFAQPNTITGSIGVFGMMFSIDRMMKNKLGVTFDEVKNAPYADFPTGTRPLTPAEGVRMQRAIDTIYAKFKGHVVAGRALEVEAVDSIAQGRVWTGVDALRIGLVDGLGGMERAIESAAAKAGLKSYKVLTYPESVDKLSTMMKRFSANTEAKVVLKSAIKEELGDAYTWYEKVKSLRDMNGRAMMAMPFVLTVK